MAFASCNSVENHACCHSANYEFTDSTGTPIGMENVGFMEITSWLHNNPLEKAACTSAFDGNGIPLPVSKTNGPDVDFVSVNGYSTQYGAGELYDTLKVCCLNKPNIPEIAFTSSDTNVFGGDIPDEYLKELMEAHGYDANEAAGTCTNGDSNSSCVGGYVNMNGFNENNAWTETLSSNDLCKVASEQGTIIKQCKSSNWGASASAMCNCNEHFWTWASDDTWLDCLSDGQECDATQWILFFGLGDFDGDGVFDDPLNFAGGAGHSKTVPCGEGFWCDSDNNASPNGVFIGDWTVAGCDQTDTCGICGGNDGSCLDCANVANGTSRVDNCGACVECGDSEITSGGPSGLGECTENPLWDSACSGCWDSAACNYNESIVPGFKCTYHFNPCWVGTSFPENCNWIEDYYDGSNPEPVDSPDCFESYAGGTTTNTCQRSSCNSSSLGNIDASGANCWYHDNRNGLNPNENSGTYCDCAGEPFTTGCGDGDQPCCNCEGGVGDDCGDCAGGLTFDPTAPIISSHMGIFEDNAHPWGDTDGDGTGDGPFQNYTTGLFREAITNNLFCDCDRTPRYTETCFDASSGVLDENVITIDMCPGQLCSHFNVMATGYDLVNDIDEAGDWGCMHPDACNYNELYDKDCLGVVPIGRGGGGRGSGEQAPVMEEVIFREMYGDASCCVMPAEYCIADGSVYFQAGDGLGHNDLCDINWDNRVPLEWHETWCPICDCSSNLCDNGPCDCPDECYGTDGPAGGGTGGYVSYPYNPANEGGYFQTNWANLMENGGVETPGSYIYAGSPEHWDTSDIYLAGDEGGAPGYMVDTCTVNCGINQQFQPTDIYVISGCTDEAAINYGVDGEIPLWDVVNPPDTLQEFLNSIGMGTYNPNSFDGVSQVCQYCPGPDIVGECLAGYDFYWLHDVQGTGTPAGGAGNPYNISLENRVSYGVNDYGEFFHLGDVESNVLSNSIDDDLYYTGACFCKTDLNFLDSLADTIQDYPNHPLFVSGQKGSQNWNSKGRLTHLSGGGFTNFQPTDCGGVPCQDNFMQLGGIYMQEGPGSNDAPLSFESYEASDQSWLNYLDLSFGYLSGDIPRNIEALYNTNLDNPPGYVLDLYLNLGFNDFTGLKETDEDGGYVHTMLGLDSFGICKLVDINGFPAVDTNPWLVLKGNKICPNISTNSSNETSFPPCLVPENGTDLFNSMSQNHATWVFDNLGFVDLPADSGYFEWNYDAQGICNWDADDGSCGTLNCPISGCPLPEATNYNPLASADCAGVEGGDADSCCIYDDKLHFPWGPGSDTTGDIQSGPPGGCFGCNLTPQQMIYALNANICGFSYTSFGALDQIAGPNSGGGGPNFNDADPACSYGQSPLFEDYGMLPWDFINNCVVTYPTLENAGDSLYIDIWDGMYISNSPDRFEGVSDNWLCQTLDGEPLDGDSRPFEFLQMIEYWKSISGGNSTVVYNSYILNYFAFGENDYSMSGLEYFDDFDIDGDGSLLNDMEYWQSIGRIDIVYLIQDIIDGIQPYPPTRPIDYELWEQAPVTVNMSYSKKFISEDDAGFTLYSEPNSGGVFTRSGQWTCSDGGPADICYDHIDKCLEDTPDNVYCTPCGNETSDDDNRYCEPMIVDTAAEGHEKISKTKIITIPYFGNSALISGSSLYTGSLSSDNKEYYYNVTDGDPDSSNTDTVFSVAWGHISGAGSFTGSGDTSGRVKGTSEAVYKSYSSMLLDDSKVKDGFFITSGSDVIPAGVTEKHDDFIYVLNFKRSKFEDQIQVGNWTLNFSGSNSAGGVQRTLTDNSILEETINTTAGRRYDIISGSGGTPFIGYQKQYGRYGFFYPDVGIMVLGKKLVMEMSGSTSTLGPALFDSAKSGSRQLLPYITASNGKGNIGNNAIRLVNVMKNVSEIGTHGSSGPPLKLYGEKEVTEVIYVCRLEPDEFNFTSNPSILSGSGRTMFVPGVGVNPDVGVMNGFPTSNTSSAFLPGSTTSTLISGSGPYETTTALEDGLPFEHPGINTKTMHGNPHTFITGVQLYDQHGEMLAIAQLSTPLKKASDRELRIKVKLTY